MKKRKNIYSSVCRGDSRQGLSSLPPASDLPACFSFLIPSLEISKSTNRQASHSPLASAGPSGYSDPERTILYCCGSQDRTRKQLRKELAGEKMGLPTGTEIHPDSRSVSNSQALHALLA